MIPKQFARLVAAVVTPAKFVCDDCRYITKGAGPTCDRCLDSNEQ